MFINHLEYLKTLLSEPGVLFASSVNGITQPTLAKISKRTLLLKQLRVYILTNVAINLAHCSLDSASAV